MACIHRGMVLMSLYSHKSYFSPSSFSDDGRVGPLHKVFSRTSQRFSMCLRSGSQSMCEDDVSRSLNLSFTVSAWWILPLSSWNMPCYQGRKNLWMENPGHSEYSGCQMTWATEAAPDHYTPPPTGLYMPGSRLDGGICLSSYPDALWNRENLDSSGHMTFALLLQSPANWRLFSFKNAEKSRQILFHHAAPSGRRLIDPKFILQPKHTANIINNYLHHREDQGVLEVRVWPPQNADLHII